MSLDKSKLNKDTFCMAPWTEMHFGVKKDVLPCCVYDMQNPFGSLLDTNDVTSIYNSDKAKETRNALFNGIKLKECTSCWKSEELSKNESYREFHNEYYGDYLDEVLENTNEDFSLKKITLRRLDIRFDNKCNLKCRICNSDYSTAWYADDVKLGRKPAIKTDVYKQTINSEVFDFIIGQLSNVDEIFFAGGEPLMQDGHYLILEKAIELGYQDRIRLTYNTNFSSLKYKDKDIIELWSKFEQVNIGASLDASHKQGEYQRKNIIWSEVVSNRKEIINKLPDSTFTIIPTVGILNVYNILNFHKEWVELGLLDVNRIDINLLSEPTGYNIQHLPDHHKERILKLYKNHIEWLTEYGNADKAINEFTKVINYIKIEGSFESLSHFIEYNQKLDTIREESFFEVFPEYSDLEWYIKHKMLRKMIGDDAIKTIGSLTEELRRSKEFILNLEHKRDELHALISERDSFISKTLHETGYVQELEKIREELNQKLSERDAYIAKALHEADYITELEKNREELNQKLSERDSFIAKTLHETNYVQELEQIRDELNQKLRERDSVISEALLDKDYVSELELTREQLYEQLSEKNSFIHKTLLDTNYLNEVNELKEKLSSLSKSDKTNMEDFFNKITKVTNRLTRRIKEINKETGYKSLM